MGYVATAEEVAAKQAIFRNLNYGLETASVTFSTDPGFVREVLPPCFAPADRPRGMVRFGRALTDDGGIGLEYNYCACYVRAQFGDIEGWYHLTMFLSDDMGVILGRELYGEAKKVGNVQLDISGTGAQGRATRHGKVLLELDADFGPSIALESKVDHTMHVKMYLDVHGQELEYDPIVVVEKFSSRIIDYREGTGSVALASSHVDYCGTLPVLEIEKAIYEKSFFDFEFFKYPQTSREGYLPFLLGRSYDIFAAT